jgi:hypothetical protein
MSLKFGLWAPFTSYEFIYMKRKIHKKNMGDGMNGFFVQRQFDQKLISVLCLPFSSNLSPSHMLCTRVHPPVVTASAVFVVDTEGSAFVLGAKLPVCQPAAYSFIAQGIMHDAYRYRCYDAKQGKA